MPHELFIELMRVSSLIEEFGPEAIIPKETYHTISSALLEEYDRPY